jgi:adenylate cyclase
VDLDLSGLLDGLEGEERDARLKLLERLAHDGAELEELRQAVREDRLALLPLERVLGGHHTAREVADQANIDVEWLLRVRRALGLPEAQPDERVFSDDDVKASQAMKLLIDAGLPEAGLLESTRVLGEGMSRFAATITAMFARTFLERGDSELDVALRYEAMATELTPATEPILAAALSAHLRENTRRAMLGRAQREAGSPETNQDIVVCFADLVGFTALGGQVAAEELGSLAGRLAELAAEVATEPVRLVKTIGDAAMFISPEAAPMVAAALALVEAVEQADLPSLRTGLASGSALQRAGDWYGHPVNIASRVTGIARPGSVLCTEEVQMLAADDFAWSYAGRHRIKGVSEPLALHRARPLEREDGEAEEPHGEASSPRAGRRRRRASNSGE